MSEHRYSRQQLVPELGSDAQTKLAKSRVVLIGAGGLGCTVAQHLVSAGLGELIIVDHDQVALSNLHRQSLYLESDIGALKAVAAQQRLRKVNSSVSVQGLAERLHPNNVETLIANADLVIDAADNFAVSYLLSDAAYALNKPLLSASVNQVFGYIGGFCNGFPSFRAVFPRLPKAQTSCDTVGVTGPSVGIIASMQAQEALKLLVAGEHQLMGKLVHVDLWNYQLNTIDVSQAPESAKQTPQIKLSTADQAMSNLAFIVDVRSASEAEEDPQEFNVDCLIPLAQLQARDHQLPAEKAIALLCRSGQRALTAAQALIDQGYKDVTAILPS